MHRICGADNFSCNLGLETEELEPRWESSRMSELVMEEKKMQIMMNITDDKEYGVSQKH